MLCAPVSVLLLGAAATCSVLRSHATWISGQKGIGGTFDHRPHDAAARTMNGSSSSFSSGRKAPGGARFQVRLALV